VDNLDDLAGRNGQDVVIVRGSTYEDRAILAGSFQRTIVSRYDETGLIVAALGTNGHGYLLADESGKYAPNEWVTKAIALYHRFGADRIVFETNQGGAIASLG
jgi:phage terminase large subunit-like protein